jgi:uncharacterized caspase-like protein
MLPTIALMLLLGLFSASGASADERVALIIGNGAYAKASPLPNPARDAGAVETLLRKAGFTVVARHDVGVSAMRRGLRDFTDLTRDAEIAVVFYAGHGIEVSGNNYLIPVDAALERDIDVEDEAVSLDRVMQILEPARRLRLVILDACRDNPFTRSIKRTVASRSIGRGLAKVDVLTSDTLIAFAAKHGSTAADGEGLHSPYTSALLKHLVTPGLDLRLALGRVRDEVLKSTANKQEPFVYGSLGGAEISLAAAVNPERQASPPPSTAPPPSSPTESVAQPSLFTEQDAKRLQALGSKHGLVLPEFQMEMPAPDVPAPLRRFVGIWFDETGGEGANKGKKNMLIVTRVDKNGRAEGYLAHGPPTPTSYSRKPAGSLGFIGRITESTLRFSSGAVTYSNRLTPDNRIYYLYSNSKGQTASRYLNPVWTLSDVERSTKR